jgi:hypothetical protein
MTHNEKDIQRFINWSNINDDFMHKYREKHRK